jgi:hypothetical protein
MKLALLPLLFLSLAAFAPLDEARLLIEAGKLDQAYALAREHSDAGDPSAHEALAWFLDEGKVVAKDRAAAARLFRAAAQAGRMHSQWRLGVMLDTGDGVAADPVEALRWLEKAAAQDYPPAMVSMAVMNATGRGMPVDYGKARAWYEKGARRGHPHGFYGMGVLLANGQGVERNMVESLAWMLVSANLGNREASASLEAYHLSREDVLRAGDRANAIAREYGQPELKFDVRAPDAAVPNGA